jgi:TonB family protein
MDTTHESLLTGRDPRLLRAVTLSALAHVLVLGLAFYLGSRAPSSPLIQTKPIIAHLVRLGTPRDPKLLPRKYRQPPPPPPQVALPVKTHQKLAPRPKVKPRTDKRTEDPLAAAISKVADQWDKHARPEKPPGAADGNPNGDAVTASEGDRYLALVEQQIHSNYKVPATISDRERLYLNATVVVYVAPDGHITRTWMEQGSGNQQFDDALLRAIAASNPLPPPPGGWRDKFMNEGLGVKFRL